MTFKDPSEITYETIVDFGKKICIGHSIGYTLHISGHYFVAYENLPINYLWVDLNNNKIYVYFADGSVSNWTSTFFGAYITQFGIAVSHDGRYIFAQTWENGLYCFSSETGEKIWRTKSKSGIKNVYVNDKTVTANNRGKMLQLINIDTGEVLCERKTAICELYAVDSKHFMCRTTSKKWEIIDSNTLEKTESFSSDDREKVQEWFSVFYGNAE